MAPAITTVSKPKSRPPNAATTVLFKSVEFSFMAPAWLVREKIRESSGIVQKLIWKREARMREGILSSCVERKMDQLRSFGRKRRVLRMTRARQFCRYHWFDFAGGFAPQENRGRNIP